MKIKDKLTELGESICYGYEYMEEAMVFLEELRQEGVTNMFGATPYLIEGFLFSEREASKVLSFWMDNYNELLKEDIIQRG